MQGVDIGDETKTAPAKLEILKECGYFRDFADDTGRAFPSGETDVSGKGQTGDLSETDDYGSTCAR